MANIGIYPGTFDPVHEGHVSFALAAAEKFHLDTVLFIPEKFPRNKPNVTDLARRFQQIIDSIRAYDSLDVILLEDDQFTVNTTLPTLNSQFSGNKLYLLIGSDVAKKLSLWQSIDELLPHMKLIVGIRSLDSKNDVARALEPLDVHVDYVMTENAHVSSSMYRARSSNNKNGL